MEIQEIKNHFSPSPQKPAWEGFFSSFSVELNSEEKKMIIRNFFDFSSKRLQHIFQHALQCIKKQHKN